MVTPFDPDRCAVPPLVRLPASPLLGDVTVPEPPEEIVDCLAALTPFVDDLGCLPLTVQGGTEATFPVRTTSSTVGGLTLRITPGPGCAYDFDLDLALPCPPLAAPARPRPVVPMDYSSDSTGTLALTITPGPGCVYDLAATLAAVSPGLIAVTESAGLSARDRLTLGAGFVDLFRLDRWTGRLVPTQTHIKTYNAKLAPVAGERFVLTTLTDGALLAIGPAAGTCYTVVTGTIVGGLGSVPLPGATLQITGSQSGTDYGTFAATDGTYSIPLVLATDDTALDLVVTGPGIRFTAGPPVTRAITPCVPNAVAEIRATPAAGYDYLGALAACLLPFSHNLEYANATLGTGRLQLNLEDPDLPYPTVMACLPRTTIATSSCPDIVTTAVRLGLIFARPQLYFSFAAGSFPCAAATDCASGGAEYTGISGGPTMGLLCPSDPYSATGGSLEIKINLSPGNPIISTTPFVQATFTFTEVTP